MSKQSKVNAKRCAKLLFSTHSEKSVIVASLIPLSNGQPLSKKLDGKHMQVSDKLQIVRDLVRMYRQMYERRIIHMEVMARHIFYSVRKKRTTIIDFNLHENLKKEDPDCLRWQEWQLYQLLTLIGDLCAYEKRSTLLPASLQRKPLYKVEHLTGGHHPDTFPPSLNKLIPPMRKCHFDEELPSSIMNMKNMTQRYEKLVLWSG